MFILNKLVTEILKFKIVQYSSLNIPYNICLTIFFISKLYKELNYFIQLPMWFHDQINKFIFWFV